MRETTHKLTSFATDNGKHFEKSNNGEPRDEEEDLEMVIRVQHIKCEEQIQQCILHHFLLEGLGMCACVNIHGGDLIHIHESAMH